ncbi:uncharacterized protein T551_00694 [Pneumocystis jirovecii RU7]|uniref:Cyclin-like domain-containing protein n=1 Tax=Pneumocystis jirovecii (strain RU7) TaxID=1408657 RepID=A0A0W4ZUG6_PNEJ7|nr:uncharacterized protein T551_00694 [Pneumocystis jirovecii RU7]KTW32012.1 hypothetical protein T551_00694 [Pneumocystis jirovecii RU7]
MAYSASDTQELPFNDDKYPVAVQLSWPYFSTKQVASLSASSRSSSLSESKETQIRFQACTWIYHVGRSMKLSVSAFFLIKLSTNILNSPIRTIGSAMIIYHRFHLFNPMSEFSYIVDTAAACLFVACKMEDTSKKLKDILIASYNLKHPNGPDISFESQTIEEQKKRIIGLERMVLETSCFDFRQRHPQPYIIKFARHLKRISKEIARKAWDISIDSYKTFSPLKFPPHCIALMALVLSSILLEQPFEDAYEKFMVKKETLIKDALCDILDLYIHHRHVTIVGHDTDVSKFMIIQISLNKFHKSSEISLKDTTTNVEFSALPFRIGIISDKGTVRFILDHQREKNESEASKTKNTKKIKSY